MLSEKYFITYHITYLIGLALFREVYWLIRMYDSDHKGLVGYMHCPFCKNKKNLKDLLILFHIFGDIILRLEYFDTLKYLINVHVRLLSLDFDSTMFVYFPVCSFILLTFFPLCSFITSCSFIFMIKIMYHIKLHRAF